LSTTSPSAARSNTGSMRAVNYLYGLAPKDGSTIGTFGRDMPLIGIIGHNQNLRFDARKFTWLGSSSSYASDAYMLFVRKDAAVTSIADARRPGGQIIQDVAAPRRDGDEPVLRL